MRDRADYQVIEAMAEVVEYLSEKLDQCPDDAMDIALCIKDMQIGMQEVRKIIQAHERPGGEDDDEW
ncbi:MAG: hypothetical protein EOO40_02070 [Deltaproteobacteria bacterium]|nr:MAG: hypothetical protein EOO40_02070 [Deltaproteobacteria bacterium]